MFHPYNGVEIFIPKINFEYFKNSGDGFSLSSHFQQTKNVQFVIEGIVTFSFFFNMKAKGTKASSGTTLAEDTDSERNT